MPAPCRAPVTIRGKKSVVCDDGETSKMGFDWLLSDTLVSEAKASAGAYATAVAVIEAMQSQGAASADDDIPIAPIDFTPCEADDDQVWDDEFIGDTWEGCESWTDETWRQALSMLSKMNVDNYERFKTKLASFPDEALAVKCSLFWKDEQPEPVIQAHLEAEGPRKKNATDKKSTVTKSTDVCTWCANLGHVAEDCHIKASGRAQASKKQLDRAQAKAKTSCRSSNNKKKHKQSQIQCNSAATRAQRAVPPDMPIRFDIIGKLQDRRLWKDFDPPEPYETVGDDWDAEDEDITTIPGVGRLSSVAADVKVDMKYVLRPVRAELLALLEQLFNHYAAGVRDRAASSTPASDAAPSPPSAGADERDAVMHDDYVALCGWLDHFLSRLRMYQNLVIRYLREPRGQPRPVADVTEQAEPSIVDDVTEDAEAAVSETCRDGAPTGGEEEWWNRVRSEIESLCLGNNPHPGAEARWTDSCFNTEPSDSLRYDDVLSPPAPDALMP